MGLWQPQLALKLKVRVVLLGVEKYDSSTLERCLSEVLSSYDAPVVSMLPRLESGPDSRRTSLGIPDQVEPLKVRYDISYEVRHASEKAHDDYLHILSRAAEVDASTAERGSHGLFLVPISAVSQAMEDLAENEAGLRSSAEQPVFGDSEVILLVANPSREGLRKKLETSEKLFPTVEDPGLEFEYSFAEAGSVHYVERKRAAGGGHGEEVLERRSTCATSWVGQKRVLVLDLGAAGCEYGAIRESAPHSTVTEVVFPSGTLQARSGDWLPHSSKRGRKGSEGELGHGRFTVFRLGRHCPLALCRGLCTKMHCGFVHSMVGHDEGDTSTSLSVCAQLWFVCLVSYCRFCGWAAHERERC